MPKISTYQQQIPEYEDFVLGIDTSDTTNDPGGQTIKIKVEDLGVARIRENVQTGSSYSLVLVDSGKILAMNSAAVQTVVLPANSTTALPVGFSVTVMQEGVGVVTIDAASGVTIRAIDGGSGQISARYGSVTLYKRAINEWVAIGAIGAVT